MPEPRLPLGKRILFSFLTIALISIITLFVAEVALRLAALFAGPRALVPSGSGKEEVILCLGDSNTYGVFYDQDQAYPGQLQSILDRRAPGKYRVLNLGLPGMNSPQVVTRLPGWLDQYRPRAVVVSVGINNYWNRADASHQSPQRSLIERMRLYRLLHLLMAETTSGPAPAARPQLERVLLDEGAAGVQQRDAATGELLIAHEGDVKDWNRSHSEVAVELYDDLSAMDEMTASRGVDLLVMTYAAFPLPGRQQPNFDKQQNLNETMRRFSKDHAVTLVDVRDRFLELLPSGQPRELFFASPTESHPNPTGYREVAMLVAGAIHSSKTDVFSFVDHFDEAIIEREMVPYEQVMSQRIRIVKDDRRAIFQHPTTTITFADVSIGERAILELAIALTEDAWQKPGDGVQFSIDIVDDTGQVLEQYSRYIDPKQNPDQRRWIDEHVDVSALSGRTVTFVFRTSPGPEGNTLFDWAAWGDPRLVSDSADAS